MTTCSTDYSNFWENVKYIAQVLYLAPPAILYIRILHVIWGKYKSVYSQHQFFVIYSIDSVVGLLLLLLDIFITRLFVYLPQLCLPASRFFLSHPFLMDLYYPLLNYLHCAQPLIQIFLTTNRMSSVLFPVDHNKIWKRKLPLIALFIAFTPFLFIWDTIISPKIAVYYFGGFFMIGTNKVKWANVSLFLFTIRSIAVGITVFSTSMMFVKMSKMTKRLKRSEKTLCLACAVNSACFMVPSFFEALATFYEPYGSSWINYLIQPFAWDVLNVGSPIIMIFVSSQLRHHVFSRTKSQSTTTQSAVLTLSGTQLQRNSSLT